HPDDRLVRRRLVHSLLALGRTREALPHARALYDAGYELGDARMLAALELRLSDFARARDLALEVHRRGAGDWDAASFAVALLGKAKEPGKAIDLAKKTTEGQPQDYRSWLLYADALTQSERLPDAVRALDRAGTVIPDSVGAISALGRAYTEASVPARAE